MARPRQQRNIDRERMFTVVERHMRAVMAPVIEAQRWYLRAACRDTDPEVFYPAADVTQGTDRRDQTVARLTATAKGICNGNESTGRRPCPVRLACLAYAMAEHEKHGIWGGMTVAERDSLRRAGYTRNQARVRAVQARAARDSANVFDARQEG